MAAMVPVLAASLIRGKVVWVEQLNVCRMVQRHFDRVAPFCREFVLEVFHNPHRSGQ